MKKIILTAAVCLGGYVPLQGQVSLTIEKAMDIAEEHSPSLRRSHMNRNVISRTWLHSGLP